VRALLGSALGLQDTGAIAVVPRAVYANWGTTARRRIRDQSDWPTVALALSAKVVPTHDRSACEQGHGLFLATSCLFALYHASTRRRTAYISVSTSHRSYSSGGQLRSIANNR